MGESGQRGRKQRVLIAGAGVGGLEAALALDDLAGDLVEVALCDSGDEFVFRPFTVGEPYGAVRSFRYALEELSSRCGASFRRGKIDSVDVERGEVAFDDGERRAYDHLIVATGSRLRWAVPGAITFWGANEGGVSEAIDDLRAGHLRHLVLTMPAGYTWALPLYELALFAAHELEKVGNRETRVTIVTPEDMPLDVFGRHAATRVDALLRERRVEVVTAAHPIEFRDGLLRIAPGRDVEADAVISLPRFEGRSLPGVPHDGEGFIGVEEHGGVIGLKGVYAIGDVTTFPVKQGALTTQQADAVAEVVASAAGAAVDPRPFDPVLRGVLWTGRRPRYLYGRPTGGHGETSSFSERPEGPMRDGKLTARYLTPLVDRLTKVGAVAAAIAQASLC
ncbi:MAG TPA: FAD-dependent oxidoreductase [Solirubrobacterales bacterium]|nr:FAD-dependent oxidoreductase [Solirubrobacterales bacterium]